VLFELVFFVQLARIATRTRILPKRVISPHLPEHYDEYTEYFGVGVKQGPSPKLWFFASDASRPFLTSNEKIWAVFEPALRKRLADLDESARKSGSHQVVQGKHP